MEAQSYLVCFPSTSLYQPTTYLVDTLNPTGYADMVWATEAFTLGAYGSFNPPGVLTSLGAAVDGPAGNVHFAGADYSPEWPGYMEGAIRSGSAVANQVLATL